MIKTMITALQLRSKFHRRDKPGHNKILPAGAASWPRFATGTVILQVSTENAMGHEH
jgi:hypothetical protein